MKLSVSTMVITTLVIALAGCMDADMHRPRLLDTADARVGNLNEVQPEEWPVGRDSLEPIVRAITCSQTHNVHGRPKLVIGEPVCTIVTNKDLARVD